MVPVGLTTSYMLSSPVVRNNTVLGFYDGWRVDRTYPIDMAGFAISVSFFLLRPNASFPNIAGHLETGFLTSLEPFKITGIEPLANNCSKVSLIRILLLIFCSSTTIYSFWYSTHIHVK